MSAFFFAHPKETDLALFAGGESGPFARWRIERHLETCPHCEKAVADYFHLADDLSVLGETPDLDWAAMSAGIQARLAMEAPELEVRRGMPAWTWQLGAAAACAMVAFAVLQIGPQAEKARAPAAEQAIADNRAVVAADPSAPPASAPMEQAARERNEETPARQLDRFEVQPTPRADAASEPLLEKKAELLALADREEGLSTDAAAPPPPAKAVATEADSVQLAQESRARESFAGEGARRVARPAAAPAAGLGFTGGAVSMQQVAFGMSPLPAAGETGQVGADGWVSFRAVNADGAMTITDVYEPQ
jgi:hypothetical protein